MGYQTTPNGSLGLPCGLYQLMSHILKAQNCCWSLNGCISPPSSSHPLPPPTPPPTSPTPIDSIRDITELKKLSKTSSIQIACCKSYKMTATHYLYNMFIWRDCNIRTTSEVQCIQYFKSKYKIR